MESRWGGMRGEVKKDRGGKEGIRKRGNNRREEGKERRKREKQKEGREYAEGEEEEGQE